MSRKYKPEEPINIGRFLADHGAKKKKSKAPHVWLDPYSGKPYRSPLSQKEIGSRRERREEMKEFNVREVDPSEGPHRDRSRFHDPNVARRHGLKVEE